VHPLTPFESPAPPGALAEPPALPAAGWVVGSEGRAPASGPDAAARRAARLDARLAVYAHHAAALAEQAAATLTGDQARADALGLARSAAAEHFAELQADAGAASTGAASALPPFDALLSDALLELEHQAAVDLALRQRLVALREAMARGATWVSETGLPALPAGVAAAASELEALPDLAPATPSVEEALDEVDEAAPTRALEGLEGGLVAARADGVGRALGGQYPGLVSREAAASTLAAAERVGERPTAGMADTSGSAGHVDLTF
jgi:hypothetical protein